MHCVNFLKENLFTFEVLAYQTVLPHGLIKIYKNKVNNYNYVSHALFHQLNTLTHTLKYIFIII